MIGWGLISAPVGEGRILRDTVAVGMGLAAPIKPTTKIKTLSLRSPPLRAPRPADELREKIKDLTF
jgi:hypothetical protein